MARNQHPSHTSSWSIHTISFPHDVAQHIVTLLSLSDVCALGSCSREWHDLCSSSLTWVTLYKQRWPIQCKVLPIRTGEHRRLTTNKTFLSDRIDHEGWRAGYIHGHKRMAMAAASVVEFVKTRACNESLEVPDYQKAMTLLCSLGLGFQDVQMFLLLPKHSVLVNLLGLHYCLAHLCVQIKDAKAALIHCRAAERQVCLRWWSLGRWVNGFRRHDEMHVCTTSLCKLTEIERPSLFQVIERGALHEVLRVQISADFRSSAWVARDMHSQR